MSLRSFTIIFVTVFGVGSGAFAKITAQPYRRGTQQGAVVQPLKDRLEKITYAHVRNRLTLQVDNHRVIELWDKTFQSLDFGTNAPLFFDVVTQTRLPDHDIKLAGPSLVCILTLAYTLNAGGPAVDMNGRPTVPGNRSRVTQPVVITPPLRKGNGCQTSNNIIQDWLSPSEDSQVASDHAENQTFR